jgi:hypothetical protein
LRIAQGKSIPAITTPKKAGSSLDGAWTLEVLTTRAEIVTAIAAAMMAAIVYRRPFGTPESFRMRYVKGVVVGTLAKVTCDQLARYAKVQ